MTSSVKRPARLRGASRLTQPTRLRGSAPSSIAPSAAPFSASFAARARVAKPSTPRSRAKESTQTRSIPGGISTSVLVWRLAFIAIVACLLLFGLVMLYSASSISSYTRSGDFSSTFTKQLVCVVIGIIVAVGVALVPYKFYSPRFSAFALLATIPLLIAVLILGNTALGAQRWIDLGFTTLQPSEFTKIAIILVLIHLVERTHEEGVTGTNIFLMVAACVVPLGFIVAEPDLGTSIIAVAGIFAVLWFGGFPKRVVGIMGLVGIVGGSLLVFGSGFRSARLDGWLDPAAAGDSGLQLLNSYYAFGEGGIFGVGLGLSKQKFNWLPMSENDFLFAIVGEELGLIGALFVMLLFVAFVFVALRIASGAPDRVGSMIAGASGVLIGAQAFLNMLCVVGALPTTGKPLPFFSAGGSSIVSTMILVGLVLSVSMQSRQANVYDFRREQLTVVSGGASVVGAAVGGAARSVLESLPNPAALVSALLPKPAELSRARNARNARAQSGRVQGSRGQTGRAQAGHDEAAYGGAMRGGGMVRGGAGYGGTARGNGAGRGSAGYGSAAHGSTTRGSAAHGGTTRGSAGYGSSTRSGGMSPKVMPISRGQAEKAQRDKHARHKLEAQKGVSTTGQRSADLAPISMAALRRKRARQNSDSSTGGNRSSGGGRA